MANKRKSTSQKRKSTASVHLKPETKKSITGKLVFLGLAVAGVIALIVTKSSAKAQARSGVFDWVGPADYADKTNYYAGIHLSNPSLAEAGLQVGNSLKIGSGNWPEANGKTFKILKINSQYGTAVIDTPAPLNAGYTNGTWQIT